MQKLNANFEVQETQLDDTKSNMQSMADNVDNVSGLDDRRSTKVTANITPHTVNITRKKLAKKR